MISERLFRSNPDVVCVTEGYPDVFGMNGCAILSGEDHGYKTTDGRRKAMLWSKHPWYETTIGKAFDFPSGRFISGITQSPIGFIRFVGICIPWQSAHLTTGEKNRRRWEEHIRFLHALEAWLNSNCENVPIILLGDFNQRIPRAKQPLQVFDLLCGVLGTTFQVLTGGTIPGTSAQSIDHIAATHPIELSTLEPISNLSDEGIKLSDHFGIEAKLQKRTSG